jgi:WD40 repeat protein
VQAAGKIESFCISRDESFIFAGDISGRVLVYSARTLELLGTTLAHAGTIIAMAACPADDWFACLGMDRAISVWRYDRAGMIALRASALIRNLRPANDPEDVSIFSSNAQTLDVHGHDRKIITRSGNGGIAELEWTENGHVEILYCTRFHANWDTISAKYVPNSNLILTGSGDGGIVLSEGGAAVREWRVASESIHWFEPIKDGQFLVASDARLVANLDIHQADVAVIGPAFARDDLEHISYNKRSTRAFASSFDRNIYEVDPNTCEPIQVVFHAPFKCRWIHSFANSPQILLVQCRDGGLHLVDVDQRASLAAVRTTPKAVWTADTIADGSILFAGEGPWVSKILNLSEDLATAELTFSQVDLEIPGIADTYVKRLVACPREEAWLLGTTSGKVVKVLTDAVAWEVDLGSAIRDLVAHPVREEAIAICEDGSLHKIGTSDGTCLTSEASFSGTPKWSTAVSPNGEHFATFERYGNATIRKWQNLEILIEDCFSGRAKRAKWSNDNTILHSYGGQIYQWDMQRNFHESFLQHVGNTVEDFIWDINQNYLIAIAYTNMISLYDFQTRQLLAVTYDQMDYSKGLAWISLSGSVHPFEFVTFGRSGGAYRYRIHNDNILYLGPLTKLLKN